MSSLCQYCSVEVFGQAGWRRVWAVKTPDDELGNSVPRLDYERPYNDLLASCQHPCWFCNLIMNDFNQDLDSQGLVTDSLCFRIDLYYDHARDLIPATIGYVQVQCRVYTSDANDGNDPKREDTDDQTNCAELMVNFEFDVGVTTTLGRPFRSLSDWKPTDTLWPPRRPCGSFLSGTGSSQWEVCQFRSYHRESMAEPL